MLLYLATQSHFYRTEASIKSDLNVSHRTGHYSSTLNSHTVKNLQIQIRLAARPECTLPVAVWLLGQATAPTQQPHTGSVEIKDGCMDGQLARIFKGRNSCKKQILLNCSCRKFQEITKDLKKPQNLSCLCSVYMHNIPQCLIPWDKCSLSGNLHHCSLS